ncbi:protein VAC14 homolog [Pocillopora damicornis]|uniref:protein VAC14 homolog n=1 Tax=Pocillopora damicornis TaxID=46731 RepID=UPI000F550D28|nr:protein VAC14 homolog [Pocillopora damicornis]
MAEKDFLPLTQNVVRGLNDKLYEKRKTAALEIERMVKEFVASNDVRQIKRLTAVLADEFAVSHNNHSRKGGLIGLAATAIALGKDAGLYLKSLIPPVLTCFYDQDSRVRYYACEALYNIAKVARGSVLPFFNDVFDGLSKLAADPDMNVKNGAELLDRLVKDIVTESSSFDLVSFIPLLRDRIYTANPFAKQFLVSWLMVLDAVPDLDLITHLPEFLDGLFNIFKDRNPEIRKMCETALGEFLRGIKRETKNINFADMVNILVIHSQSEDEVIQFTAITWLREFITLSGRTMLPFNAGILKAILPCMAYDQDKQNIKEVAKTVNQSLMRLITEDDDKDVDSDTVSMDCDNDFVQPQTQTQLDLGPVVDVLTVQLSHKSIQTRIAVLRWVLLLHMKTPNKIFGQIEQLFPELLKTLSDPSDEVVLLVLEALAEISASPAGPPRNSPSQSMSEGSLPGSEFLSENPSKPTSSRNFLDLIFTSGHLEVNVEFLIQIDKLVQLIESPIFTYLRLQLLDTQKNHFLLKSLYGLLMLLPQSDAFTTLRNRLDCVPNGRALPSGISDTHGAHDFPLREHVQRINFKELLHQFKTVQQKHFINKHSRSPHLAKNLLNV